MKIYSSHQPNHNRSFLLFKDIQALTPIIFIINKMESKSLKDLANDQFRARKFLKAIDLYTESIESNQLADHTVYSNRSAAYVQVHKFQLAINDADECIRIKPEWEKGHQRRATALKCLNAKSVHFSNKIRKTTLIATLDKFEIIRCQKRDKPDFGLRKYVSAAAYKRYLILVKIFKEGKKIRKSRKEKEDVFKINKEKQPKVVFISDTKFMFTRPGRK